MKKWMWFVIGGVVAVLGIAAAAFFLISEEQYEGPQEEIRILELTKENKTINDSIDFAIVDENGKVWIKKEHVKRVLVSYEKTKDRWLELRLTEEGLEIFKDALDESETLSIQVNGEVIASPVELDVFEEESAVIYGKDYMEEIMPWFNLLT